LVFVDVGIMHRYTQEFYESIVKAKLAPGGIFVTQSGPAGVLAHTEVFTPINKTLASVFPKVVPYLQVRPPTHELLLSPSPSPSFLLLLPLLLCFCDERS